MKEWLFLFKYHYALREGGTVLSTYREFFQYLLDEIFDTIGNELAAFPFRFIFITVPDSKDITAQLFFLRNIKRYKVMIRENFIISRFPTETNSTTRRTLFFNLILYRQCKTQK